MLKLFSLVLVIGIVASVSVTNELHFLKPNTQYTYHYESQSLSGIKKVSEQFAGIKLECNVKVQVLRDSLVLLQLEEIGVSQINDVIEGVDTWDMVPDHSWVVVTGEALTNFKSDLVKPIMFTIEGTGGIVNLKSQRTDSYWSLNIKKAIVSSFLVKFQESYKAYESNGDSLNSYSTRETDVLGECLAEYNWRETKETTTSSWSIGPGPIGAESLLIKKVKKVESCMNKNSFEQGLFAGLTHISPEKNLVDGSVVTNFWIRRMPESDLLRRVSMEAVYTFKPFSKSGGSASTHMKQELVFKGTSAILTPISRLNIDEEIPSLKMYLPHSNLTSPLTESTGPSQFSEYRKIVSEKLEEIVSITLGQQTTPRSHEWREGQVPREKIPMKLMELAILLRDMDWRVLDKIVVSYNNMKVLPDPQEEKKRQVLLDLLPWIPKPEVVKIVCDLIKKKMISPVKATIFLATVALNSKPTPESIRYLIETHSELERSSDKSGLVQQTILLTIGSLTSRIRLMNLKTRVNSLEVKLVVDEVKEFFESKLSSANGESERALVLKGIGNAGIPEHFETLRSLILKEENIYIKNQAIYALRKLSPIIYHQVQPLLISIFKAVKDPVSTRLAAFYVLIKSFPDLVTLETLVSNLAREPSKHVRTYVYTTLMDMAKLETNVRSMRDFSDKASIVLKSMKHVDVGLGDSRVVMNNLYSKYLNVECLNVLEIIHSNRSSVPEHYYLNRKMHLFDQYIDVFKTGVEGEGMMEFLRHLMTPGNGVSDLLTETIESIKTTLLSGESISTLASRIPFDKIEEILRSFKSGSLNSNIGPKIKEIFDKLKPSARGHDLSLKYFLSVLDQELYFVDVKSSSFQPLLAKALWKLKDVFGQLTGEGLDLEHFKTIAHASNSLILTTPLGLPLTMNVSVGGMVKITGSVKLHGMPSIVDIMRDGIKALTNFKIEGEVKPAGHLQVFGYMGVDAKWLRTGVALKGRINVEGSLKGHLKIDIPSRKLIIKLEEPVEGEKFIKFEVKPTTFVYEISKDIMKLPFKCTIKDLSTEETSILKVYEITETYGGVTLKVITSRRVIPASWSPYPPFTGKHYMAVHLILETPLEEEIYVQCSGARLNMEEIWSKMPIYDPLFQMSSAERRAKKLRTFNERESENYATKHLSVDPEFDPVPVDPSIESPVKVELRLLIGSNKRSKQVKVGLVWWIGKFIGEQQVTAQIVCIADHGVTKFKSVVNGVLRLPPSFNPYSVAERGSSSELYGSEDKVLGKLSIKVKVGETPSSIMTVKTRKIGLKDWQDAGMKMPGRLEEFPLVFRYGTDIEFSEYSKTVKNWVQVLIGYMQAIKYQHVSILAPESPSIAVNKITILSQFVPSWQDFSQAIYTPDETVHIVGVTLECPLMDVYEKVKLSDEYPYTFLKKSSFWRGSPDIDSEFQHTRQVDEEEHPLVPMRKSSFLDSGRCEVTGSKVTTFDGVPVLLPLHYDGTCRVLLAQDCSSTGLFSIVGHLNKRQWEVVIHVGEWEVKVSKDMEITLNGSPLPMEDDYVTTLFEGCVAKKTDDYITIKLRKLGLEIKLKLGKLYIKNLPYSLLHGSICGLCGNSDTNQDNDLTDMYGNPVSSHVKYLLDKIIPSDTCNAEEIESSLISTYDSQCQKNKIEYLWKVDDGNMKEICFSMEPVLKCSHGCSSPETLTKTVNFKCTEDNSRLATGILSRVRNGDISSSLLSQIASLPKSDSKELTIPTKCSCESNQYSSSRLMSSSRWSNYMNQWF